jgi:hypothetical protein
MSLLERNGEQNVDPFVQSGRIKEVARRKPDLM